MSSVDELVAFLRRCVDEDERVARAAIDPKHRGDWAWRRDSRSTVRERDGVPIGPGARGVEIGPHIARWNPARVLREVESKRAIVDRCAEILSTASHYTTVESCDELDAILAEQVLRDLAAGYGREEPPASHEG